MAQTVDTLITKYKMDDADYQAGAGRVTASTMRMGGAVSAGTGIIGTFAMAVGAVGAGLISLGIASGKKAAEFEAMVKALEAVVGSAEKAQKALKELRDIAAMPGLGLEEALLGYTSLRRAGLSDAMSMRTIRASGNANALASGGRAELQQILRAISQIALKPNLSGEELMQLNEAGVGASRIIQDRFGTTDGGKLSKMGVTSAEALEALVTGLEKLPKAGESSKNTIENLAMAIDEAMVAIGTGVNKGMMPFVTNFSKAVSDLTASGALEVFGTGLASAFESITDGLSSSEGLFGALTEVVVTATVASAALRNMTLNIRDMIEFASKIGSNPIRDWLLEKITDNTQTPFQEGEQMRNQLRMNMELAKRGGGFWQRDGGEADPIEEIVKPLENQTPLLKEIAENTKKLVEIEKAIVGGSVMGEAAFNSVNLSRIAGGGRSKMSDAVRAIVSNELKLARTRV